MQTVMEIFQFVMVTIAVVAVIAMVGGIWFWLTITANGANPFQ